jgi:putative nucleotidyltransferase with HDIG domain
VTDSPLELARAALAGERAWLVGGALRDRLLGRPTGDVDVAVEGDPRPAARRIARASGGACFRLSGEFGAWRTVGPGHDWHVDLVPLREGAIEADLALRDFTVNAMAEPLAGGEIVDPHGGRADLAARRLRMVSADALAADPLRTLRAVRLAVELDLEMEGATAAAVAAHAPQIARVAPERVFGELKRVVIVPAPRPGLALMEASGLTEAVLPELAALRGVVQNVFHHADVYEHTLEVLDAVVAIERDPEAAGLAEHAGAVAALLAEPLADDLTRGQAMRLAALLHDAAKPATRAVLPDGRVTFSGHDAEGAAMARAVLRRLRGSERLADYVGDLTRHHLRAGFLVHERAPEGLPPRAVWRYLRATAPHSADVTVFTVADRLATRGKNAPAAIEAHLRLARELLGAALAERTGGAPPPLVRGDELARELGIAAGPELGRLLARLEEDRYAGAIATREDALRRARELAAPESD